MFHYVQSIHNLKSTRGNCKTHMDYALSGLGYSCIVLVGLSPYAIDNGLSALKCTQIKAESLVFISVGR